MFYNFLFFCLDCVLAAAFAAFVLSAALIPSLTTFIPIIYNPTISKDTRIALD